MMDDYCAEIIKGQTVVNDDNVEVFVVDVLLCGRLCDFLLFGVDGFVLLFGIKFPFEMLFDGFYK